MTTTTTHLDATIRTPFVKSARNKLQVRETLVVINLQAKVAPSHIGANHLRDSKKRRDRCSNDFIKRPESKKK